LLKLGFHYFSMKFIADLHIHGRYSQATSKAY